MSIRYGKRRSIQYPGVAGGLALLFVAPVVLFAMAWVYGLIVLFALATVVAEAAWRKHKAAQRLPGSHRR